MTGPTRVSVKLGCIDPLIGERASLSLGEAPPPALLHHLDTCLACRLERMAFASLDRFPVSPSPTLVSRLRMIARRWTSNPQSNHE